MIVYLDSVIVTYSVEGPVSFLTRARTRLARLSAGGDQAAVSLLTRLECRVKPIRLGDAALLADFDAFFNAPDLLQFALSRPVCERATEIRARHNFKLGDSLHLAAAVESGCSVFLTNDARLTQFPDVAVEMLT
jgi:predicted nucleic acid-binding protein